MPDPMYDLILRGGHVICPAQGIDGRRDVAFADGKVALLADHIEAPAKTVQDVSGLIVTPGLIDMHTHVYWGGTSMSLDPEAMAFASGVTTMVDAGTAGPANFIGFRHFVIEPSPIRILPFINISYAGIFAYSKSVMFGECSDLRLIDIKECVRASREHDDLICGLKVRVGRISGGNTGVAPLDMAIEAAEETGLPIMTHLDDPPPTRREVLGRMRRGDIITHCFKPFPNAPVRSDGEIFDEVLAARENGIYFDIGHGAFSLGFGVARRMLEKGFAPDVISSDVHVLNRNGPVFDQMTTLSKFYCLGMSLPDVIRASSATPAEALRRPELGNLRPGSVADATVLSVDEGSFNYVDGPGEILQGRHRLRCTGLVRNGVFEAAPKSEDAVRRMFDRRGKRGNSL